jgi:SAM-dependent methyltransferase
MAAEINRQDSPFSGAGAYERFMGRWSRLLAPLFVRFAGVRDGDAVLDVGSGTGALAGAISSASPSSRVIGIDPSAPFVAHAETRRPSDRVTFEVADARHLPFGSGEFDRALSMLVFNFIPDPRAALAEIARVTRPGGTIAAAVWDYGDGMQMLRTFWDAAVALHPENDSRDERHMPLSRSGELGALWRDAGLLDVVEDELVIHTRFESFDDYWSPFTERQGPAGAYVASLADDARDELRTRLQQKLFDDGPDRSFTIYARAWAVRGAVPSAIR